jgi:hypothetical protein
MLEFVHAYVTPDGLSPVVGDADDGRALILGETEIRDHRYLLSTGAALFGRGDFKARAGRIWEDTVWLLGAEAAARFDALETREDDDSRVFPDSGFCVLRTPEQYLFADVGPVGFRGRGGHGHNDCLSFEWHAFGRPLLTDSGAYVYTPSVEWRNRFRSTEFHNTIRVDREEINRLPSASALWTLRDDARPSPARLDRQSDLVSLSGGHSGYFRLAEPVGVFRTFELERGASRLRLIDRLEGRGEHVVEFFFHARPGAKADAVSEETAGFSWEDGTRITITRVAGPAAAWEERSGWFSPSYGVKIERPIWVAIVRVSLPCELRWELGYHPRPGR